MPYARKHQLSQSLLYHVYNRSNGKKMIFEDESDYGRFMDLLREYQEKYPLKMYHWVIMPNHYHLLLEIGAPEQMSSCMSGIGRAYTHYYNKKYKSAGYLWQGRFKSQPVQMERYALACGRYIERNPLRAGLVNEAEEYVYSSARFYCEGMFDRIATESAWYQGFGTDRAQRQERYREFLLDFDEEEERKFMRLREPIGSEAFKSLLVMKNGRLIARRQGRRAERRTNIC